MKIVIQCAGSKRKSAGSLRTRIGQIVRFVAHPEEALPDSRAKYAHPDEVVEGKTWRGLLQEYNSNCAKTNPLNLSRAYDLYKNHIYRELVDSFGKSNVFILSAGWGLIRSDYLLPSYDITFSPMAEKFAQRRRRDSFEDFRMSDSDEFETILFFGGKHYQK
jgi:hypothetical protein